MSIAVLNRKTILVVDDEEDLREPIAMELESHGCRVLQASNGKQGFALAGSEKVDAVISDIRMPGGDGLELLRRLKEANFAEPAILLITGYSEQSAADAYHLGAEHVLAKPFDLDELTATLARILTPREDRWKATPESVELLKTIEQQFPSLAFSEGTGNATLGRFGFFLPAATRSPALGSRVAFEFKFTEGSISELEGTGIVRWVRLTSKGERINGCGISFEQIRGAARANVIRLTNEMKLQSAIPRA